MTLEEKLAFMKEQEEKCYLHISEKMIQGAPELFDRSDKIESFINMDDNTAEYVDALIGELISRATCSNEEEKLYLNYNLIFCGGYNELPEYKGEYGDFLMNHKDKIIAFQKYVVSSKPRGAFKGRIHYINEYSYLYLNFSKMLEIFEKHGVKIELNTSRPLLGPNMNNDYMDYAPTKFVISYNPEKIIDEEKPKVNIKNK